MRSRREKKPIHDKSAQFQSPSSCLGKDDFFAPVSLDRLAEEQGVKPISDATKLLGNFWPDDESADDFVNTIRAWRDDEPE